MRTQLASRPHAPPPVPQAPPLVPALPVPPPPPTPPSVGGNSPLLCSHVGCSTAVSASCAVRFCQALGATYTGLKLARVASVECVVATPLSPGLLPAASAPCIAPACDARFIAGVSQCVPRQVVPLLRAPLASLVRRIVLTHNVKILHIILGHLDLHVRARCPFLQREGTYRVQHIPVHSPFEHAMSVPFGPKWSGGGKPFEWRTRDPLPTPQFQRRHVQRPHAVAL